MHRAPNGPSTLARHHRHIPFEEIVSHRFAIEDAPAAITTALDADVSAKVLIVPGSSPRVRD